MSIQPTWGVKRISSAGDCLTRRALPGWTLSSPSRGATGTYMRGRSRERDRVLVSVPEDDSLAARMSVYSFITSAIRRSESVQTTAEPFR